MIAEFFCRRLPAAALRGFGASFWPVPCKTLVQLAEARQRQIDLAAHLECRGRVVAEHAQRDRLDRAQVRGHVLALDAVTAGRALGEDAVLVGEVDREPVDLRLEHICDRLVGAEPLADVVRPLEQCLVGRHLLERAHRLEVPHLLEAVRRRRADPLRRRLPGDQLRVRLLELDQLVVEAVVDLVRHRRVVEDVVLVGVPLEQRAQLGRAPRLRGRRRALRPCRRRHRAPRFPFARVCGSRPR